MTTRLTLLLSLYLMMGALCFGLQSIGHNEAGYRTWHFTKSMLETYNMEWAEPIALPLSGIATHLGTDYLIQEGDEGQYQVLRNLIKTTSWVLASTPEELPENMQIAFWNTFEDAIFKSFFHQIAPSNFIVLNREQTETIDDALLMGRVANRFMKEPRGTLISLDYRF